jgi:tRNA(Ile)-lysidine synthase
MKLITRKTDSRIELFLLPVESMEKVILRRVLRRVIEETKGLRGISFIHIEDIIDLIKKGTAGDRIYLPGDIRAIKDYATLILTSEPPVTLGSYPLLVPGETILKEAGVLIKASILELPVGPVAGDFQADLALFDAAKLVFPLLVRARKDGDFFYPHGFGKKKKLQDFFVDEKVPRDERNRVPVITSGEDIIWIAGYRADERVKVTKETTRTLKLEVKKIRD